MEEKLIKFTGIIEKEATELEFGTLTVNVVLVNGLPKIETLNIVTNKRVKYPIVNEVSVSTHITQLTRSTGDDIL